MKRVFVVTGVCRDGDAIDFPLARFLNNHYDYVLVWIDFKSSALDASTSAGSLDHAENVHVRRAPPAIWGSASIVNSMLAAIRYSLITWSDWSQILFCSNDDVPLATDAMMRRCLDDIGRYDYCGSRWNAQVSDILKPVLESSTRNDIFEPSSFVEYRLRREMSIRVDKALGHIYTHDLVSSLRLCGSLDERYIAGVDEWFSPSILHIGRMTRGRAKERYEFFSRFGLIAGRQWCVLSKRFSEIVAGDFCLEIFHKWFGDILIPDEMFFQTIANFFQQRGVISAHWDNIYFADAANGMIGAENLQVILASKKPNQLFARKRAAWLNFEKIEEILRRS